VNRLSLYCSHNATQNSDHVKVWSRLWNLQYQLLALPISNWWMFLLKSSKSLSKFSRVNMFKRYRNYSTDKPSEDPSKRSPHFWRISKILCELMTSVPLFLELLWLIWPEAADRSWLVPMFELYIYDKTCETVSLTIDSIFSTQFSGRLARVHGLPGGFMEYIRRRRTCLLIAPKNVLPIVKIRLSK